MARSGYLDLILIFHLCTWTSAYEEPQITGFGVTLNPATPFSYQSPITVDPGDVMTIQCNASGDPSPQVTISNHWEKDQQVIGKAHASNTITKVASCTEYYQFRCWAENYYKGQLREEYRTITVRVRCPPTSCSERYNDNSCEVSITHKYASCSPCIRMYPYSNDWLFHFEKETQSGWEIPTHIEVQEGYYEPYLYVRAIFDVVNISDLGNYRAVGEQRGNLNISKSYFYFEIVARPSSAQTVSTWSQTTANSKSDSDTQRELNSNGQENLDADIERDSNSNNSGQDSNSDSYLSLSTAAVVDVALAGLLVLTIFTIVCVYLCGRNNRLMKVGPQPA